MTPLQLFAAGLVGSLLYFWTGLLVTGLLVRMARLERPNLRVSRGTTVTLLLLWPVCLTYFLVAVSSNLICHVLTKGRGNNDR